MPILELQYLPEPSYFALLLSDQRIKIDRHEYFIKQTYRSRCRILGANGIDALSVPVVGGSKKTAVCDVRIDHNQKWINRHWRAIQSAYGRAPFFEYYADDFSAILHKKQVFLFDLSLELLTQCLTFLQLDIEINFTKEYESLQNRPELDYRDVISPKSNQKLPVTYTQQTYQQVFGSEFVEHLSIIDLLFCEGPQAGLILKSGIEKGTQ